MIEGSGSIPLTNGSGSGFGSGTGTLLFSYSVLLLHVNHLIYTSLPVSFLTYTIGMNGFNGIQEQTVTLTVFGKVNISSRLLRAANDLKRTKFSSKIVEEK
jgi:hypothetical protein